MANASRKFTAKELDALTRYRNLMEQAGEALAGVISELPEEDESPQARALYTFEESANHMAADVRRAVDRQS